MKRVSTIVALSVEQNRLEAEANANAVEMERALRAFHVAVRDHGDGSPQAIAAEKRADRAFERGEEIVARLVEIEAALAETETPVAA